MRVRRALDISQKRGHMITFRSSASNSSLYQVFEDENLIGYVRIQKSQTCDKYQASTYHDGKEENCGKLFDTPQDALQLIVRLMGKVGKAKGNGPKVLVPA